MRFFFGWGFLLAATILGASQFPTIQAGGEVPAGSIATFLGLVIAGFVIFAGSSLWDDWKESRAARRRREQEAEDRRKAGYMKCW